MEEVQTSFWNADGSMAHRSLWDIADPIAAPDPRARCGRCGLARFVGCCAPVAPNLAMYTFGGRRALRYAAMASAGARTGRVVCDTCKSV